MYGIKKNQKYKNTLVAKERKNISSSIIIGNIRLKYNPLYTFDVNLKSPSFLDKKFSDVGCKVQDTSVISLPVFQSTSRPVKEIQKINYSTSP